MSITGKHGDRTTFHRRYYRYVRMMLRRYPVMQGQIISLSRSVDYICGNTTRERRANLFAKRGGGAMT
jgi:hypothetical protein